MQIKSTLPNSNSHSSYAVATQTKRTRSGRTGQTPRREDSFQPSSTEPQESTAKPWLQTVSIVGGSVGEGILEGAGYAFLRHVAFAAGGPVAGGLASIGIVALGAANGAAKYGAEMAERVDSKVLGNVLAATFGAGKAGLCAGIGDPSGSINHAMFGGMAMGGTFGLIEAPGRLPRS